MGVKTFAVIPSSSAGIKPLRQANAPIFLPISGLTSSRSSPAGSLLFWDGLQRKISSQSGL
jgi:hypothetical protein